MSINSKRLIAEIKYALEFKELADVSNKVIRDLVYNPRMPRKLPLSSTDKKKKVVNASRIYRNNHILRIMFRHALRLG